MKSRAARGMARPLPCLLGAVMALAAPFSGAVAQNQYYWSNQFGNRSTLLNGTVIGGVSDLGAVF